VADLGQVKMPTLKTDLWIISGGRGVGKTTFCQKLVEQAKQSKWEIAGILSPAVLVHCEKVAIDAVDLRSGMRCRLAQRTRNDLPGSTHTSAWHFNDEALAWGNDVFKNATPCDLLVVDELGPLELENRLGWMAALEAIHSRAYQLCLLVLRPELVGGFRKQWPDFRLIELPLAKNQAEIQLLPHAGK
jgi:nucleoside-triphosphatase